MQVLYFEAHIKILKNVSPFPGGPPLWDSVGAYRSFNEIPKNVLFLLSEDEITQIAWAFEDMEQAENDTEF